MPTDLRLPLQLTTIAAVREKVQDWRGRGLRVGLVPTMGNLHAGHLSLVERISANCERTVVSIFVNPLQFGEGEDYESYPRTLKEDSEKLASVGAHAVFCPAVEQMYPDGGASRTHVSVPHLEGMLCGADRSGHFGGVATVVTKLLSIVQPDMAIFGCKDYQQLAIIRQLVKDLCLTVEIQTGPTVRDDDGLALSSRNQYLTADERRAAPVLFAQLRGIAKAVAAGERDYLRLSALASEALANAGFTPLYVSVLDAAHLGAPTDASVDLVVLAAARLGRARLIDNVTVSLVDR